MSPEQIEGKEAAAHSDIFAFGAVLYEMATGKRAFQGKSQISVASAILEKDPEPISVTKPLAPAALDYLVATCLAKDREDRFQTAHDVRLQLKGIAQSPQSGCDSAGPIFAHVRTTSNVGRCGASARRRGEHFLFFATPKCSGALGARLYPAPAGNYVPRLRF